MTHPPSETIEYERGRPMPVFDQGPFTQDVIEELRYSLNASHYDAKAVAGQIYGLVRKYFAKQRSAAEKRTLTVHIEGGLVQDVTGIPPGVEVRVEDHDEGNTSHPSWDSEKGCFVTVYAEEGV